MTQDSESLQATATAAEPLAQEPAPLQPGGEATAVRIAIRLDDKDGMTGKISARP